MTTEHPVSEQTAPPIVSDEIEISVRPAYTSEHSEPDRWQYVFVYHVTITNVGTDTVQLFWRHWLIHDLIAGDDEVKGDGVVGESPVLGPGDSHRYQSFCVLRGPTGHMEGFYHFRRSDGTVFRAPIPRFILQAPPEAGGTLLA